MTAPRKPADPIVAGGPSKPRTRKPAAKKTAAAPKVELSAAPAPVDAAQADPAQTTMPTPPVLTSEQRAAALKAQRKRNIAIGLGLVGFIIIVYLVTVLRMGGAIANRPL